MIWFAIILAVVVGGGVALISKNAGRGLKAGAVTLVLGVLVSLLIVYSGLMGG